MALHLAARNGNVNIVNLLLNINPAMVMQANNVSGIKQYTYIHYSQRLAIYVYF